MKKLYFLTLAFTVASLTVNAQNLIVGGSMESADAWTVIDLAAGDGHTETFNYTGDGPSGGDGGCLRFEGVGNWNNAAVCQKITVERGKQYLISMNVKSVTDIVAEAFWFEVVVMDTFPRNDDHVKTFPISMALNAWDCKDVTTVDGNLADFNCDKKAPLADTIAIEGEGDTAVVLVVKCGGNAPFDFVVDDVAVTLIGGGGGSNVASASLSSLNVSPNPVSNSLNVSLNETIQNIKVVNVLGQVVYSAENLGLNNVSIDFSAPKAGIYYVVVTDVNGQTGTVKTLKK
ncbi:MAG: T9SS type A sorting domain-containing protein [Bacteroidales bacterium]|nr:T9SS type A sorting domain-containing protein [Bacteroidales bacterium]